jgi:hypothetical protein
MIIKKLSFLKQPQDNYFVYLSGIMTNDKNFISKFANATRICRKKYGFIYIFNPYDIVTSVLKKEDIKNWFYCMEADIRVMKTIDKKQTIFLRIDSINKAREVKSGMLIENYIAAQNGFIICDLIDDIIILSENNNQFLRGNK